VTGGNAGDARPVSAAPRGRRRFSVAATGSSGGLMQIKDGARRPLLDRAVPAKLVEKRPMQIRDIMNINTIRILKGSTMAQAAELAALSNASGLIVVDEEDGFIGVLSEGDMMRAILPEMSEVMEVGGDLRDAYDIFSEKGSKLGAEPIDNHLIPNPVTLKPEDPLLKAASTMAVHRMRRLPVVKNGKLIGTVSRGDILKAVLK